MPSTKNRGGATGGTRRSQPERRQRDRVIKSGPTHPTDAAREGNREEVDSPEVETKGGVCGRELQNPRFTSLLQGKPKIGRGLTTTEVRERSWSREKGEGATGALPSPKLQRAAMAATGDKASGARTKTEGAR